WKSRPHGGRPKTPEDIRQLIRDMSIANPLWGAPRIHGELLKIGIRTYRCTRTRRSRVPSRLSAARWRCQFWADCTTNISERKFPTGTRIGSLVLDAAAAPHALPIDWMFSFCSHGWRTGSVQT